MICCLVSDPSRPCAPGALEAVARACSPRVAPIGDTAVIFDASGLSGMFGSSGDLAREVSRLGAARHLEVRVALSATTTAAWILAHARPGATVVTPGQEAAALAAVPIGGLSVLPEMTLAPEAAGRRRPSRARHFRMAPGPSYVGRTELGSAAGLQSPSSKFEVQSLKFHIAILERWGLHTLGDLARLPRADLHARLGPIGVRLHQAACGEDARPLVPMDEIARWMERIECDWPIEGLEPLSFVLARACETLSGRLERADRGAVEVTTRLFLVTRDVHARTLHLPSPMREARGLRTLMLLDLESHPPAAAIDVVEVELGVAPGRIVHGSLLARAVPAPEDLATLTARLGALMGETRIGAPALVDTHDERAVSMGAFQVPDRAEGKGQRAKVAHAEPLPSALCPLPCLRRYRLPIAARVVVEHHTPVRVVPSARGLSGGNVLACAGPWRTSGRWWALDRTEWDRDTWDVELADGGVYRLSRHRATGGWEIEGMID